MLKANDRSYQHVIRSGMRAQYVLDVISKAKGVAMGTMPYTTTMTPGRTALTNMSAAGQRERPLTRQYDQPDNQSNPICKSDMNAQNGGKSVDSRAHHASVIGHDVDDMMRYWMTRKREIFPAASGQFISFIDPAFIYGLEPLIEPEAFSSMFTEWLIFDYLWHGTNTLAEDYVARPPSSISTAQHIRLNELVASQFFARFIICDKDSASGMAILEDVQTALRYDVYDPALCLRDRWHNGTISERIACIEGLWLPIGPVRLYDRATPEQTAIDGPGCFHLENRMEKPEAEHASLYLRLIRDVIGVDGRYRHTTTIPPANNAQPWPCAHASGSFKPHG